MARNARRTHCTPKLSLPVLNRRGNFTQGSRPTGAPRFDIGRDGLVIVRCTDPQLDFAALQAVEPELFRLGLQPIGVCIEALHGKIFDAALDCGDPFRELQRSRLTGTDASDISLLATLLFYRDAHFALGKDILILPADHEQDLLAMVGAHCESEGAFLPADAGRLSVLAQHTLFSLAEQARTESSGGAHLVRSLRRLIAHGRLLAMLDPRRMFR
jgi:hypothetical protein